MKRLKNIFAVAFLTLLCFNLFHAQESQTLKLLNLKKTQLSLEETKGDFERALKLKEMGLISEEEFSRKQTAYLKAQVSFQEALINFIGSEARISVVSATKYKDEIGKNHVQVTLRYSSKELKELAKLNIKAEDIFPLDFLKEIKDVFISLKSEGKIISEPFEKRISSIPLEEERQVVFQLLKDVENLDLCVFYAGKMDTTSVYLQKGVSANIVTISSAQFSQEADLESQASYDLSLEKFSREANIFRLQAANLPEQITYEFVDPKTQARLSQIKFTEGVTSMDLFLKLYLPKNADAQVVIDRPIEFYVLALNENQAIRIHELLSKKRPLTSNEIESLKIGNARLELIPRGVGRLEIQAVNLYHEIKIGENAEMEVRIKNTGTRRLNNVRVHADLPLNWRTEIVPDLIPSLEQNKEEIIKIAFIPPLNVSVGDYEPKIKTECLADNRKLESEDKIVRIHITSRVNVFGIGLLLVILLGLFVLVIVYGIKLTRR